MRPLASIALLLSLLLVAAPLAAAGNGKAAENAKGKGKHEDHERPALAEHRWHQDNASDARHEGRHADEGDHAKPDRAGKAEKRAAFLDAFRAKIADWRAAWKENATAIRDACHEAAADRANATREEHRAWAHCIRDGYHDFWQALKLERSLWRGGWKHADG